MRISDWSSDVCSSDLERLFAFRDHGYIFDQMNGAQSRMPAFLINIHRVSNLSEAEAYVSRIRGMGPVLDQLSAQSRSEERRVGKEWVSTCRSRWSPYP